jgi:hypothetical protein
MQYALLAIAAATMVISAMVPACCRLVATFTELASAM